MTPEKGDGRCNIKEGVEEFTEYQLIQISTQKYLPSYQVPFSNAAPIKIWDE